jgi:pimeloyl-ACP methyl ester carboxylesterase
MPRLLAIVAALLGSVALCAQKKEADAVVAPSPSAPRGKLLEWRTAEQRVYWYRLPKQIDAKRPPNLLLMLWDDVVFQGLAFVAYPSLASVRHDDVVVSPGQMGIGIGPFADAKHYGGTLARLILELERSLPIGNVYLYGHGRSAFFCHWFAGAYPQLIDGIVAYGADQPDLDQIRHGALARHKVAIGMLHGRFEAEVAARTEQGYRDRGHEKVRRTIVANQGGEQIRPQPDELAQLLDWLDEVSVPTVTNAVASACQELREKSPDLAVIAQQVGVAQRLLPKASADEQRGQGARLSALVEFLAHCQQMAREAVLADPAATAAKPQYGPWVVQFAAANAAFAGDKAWKQSLDKLVDLAARHDLLLEKARLQLEKGGKGAYAAAVKLWDEAFLAAGGESFGLTLVSGADGGRDAAPEAQVKAARARRWADAKAGQRAWGEQMAGVLADLRRDHEDLFADPDTAK